MPEAWLRGPIPGVPGLLQPAAHALVGAREDLHAYLDDFPDDALWDRPAGVASVGFHLRHVAGVLDRLFTYARGEGLTDAQLAALEGEATPDPDATTAALLDGVDAAVDRALDALRATDEGSLLEARAVGRAGLPSTVLGLLVHAAEHAQRHTGGVIATARIVAEHRKGFS